MQRYLLCSATHSSFSASVEAALPREPLETFSPTRVTFLSSPSATAASNDSPTQTGCFDRS